MKFIRDGFSAFANWDFGPRQRFYLSFDAGVFALGWALDFRHSDPRWRIYRVTPIHARVFIGPIALNFERDGLPDWTAIATKAALIAAPDSLSRKGER